MMTMRVIMMMGMTNRNSKVWIPLEWNEIAPVVDCVMETPSWTILSQERLLGFSAETLVFMILIAFVENLLLPCHTQRQPRPCSTKYCRKYILGIQIFLARVLLDDYGHHLQQCHYMVSKKNLLSINAIAFRNLPFSETPFTWSAVTFDQIWQE